jgi:glycosyltransferase involved in cell wall biosynthesis
VSKKLPKNQGKGMALKTGFALAREKGFDYAVTLDADGQHYPSDIPKFLKAKKENTLIVGARAFGANVTGRSKFGRRLSSALCTALTGEYFDDVQSGFRLYPLRGPIAKVKTLAKRYHFEVEVVIKAMWRGMKLDHVPIKVHYDPPEIRVSHFRAFYDNFLFTMLFFRLFFVAWYRVPWYYVRDKFFKRQK